MLCEGKGRIKEGGFVWRIQQFDEICSHNCFPLLWPFSRIVFATISVIYFVFTCLDICFNIQRWSWFPCLPQQTVFLECNHSSPLLAQFFSLIHAQDKWCPFYILCSSVCLVTAAFTKKSTLKTNGIAIAKQPDIMLSWYTTNNYITSTCASTDSQPQPWSDSKWQICAQKIASCSQ